MRFEHEMYVGLTGEMQINRQIFFNGYYKYYTTFEKCIAFFELKQCCNVATKVSKIRSHTNSI